MTGSFVPGIPDTLSLIQPTRREDLDLISSCLRDQRQAWVRSLRSARQDLKTTLQSHGLFELRGARRAESIAGSAVPERRHLLFSRLKSTDALLRKMGRFGEELCCMLDIWGLRVMVADLGSLETVADLVKNHWEDIPRRQLMLRGGELHFPPVRDYRNNAHQGRSPATSQAYDQAIHVNRRAPFGGVVEVQIMTHDLFLRAFGAAEREEAHRRFAKRRAAILADNRR